MSIKTIFNLQAWNDAHAKIQEYEQKLENLLKLDVEKAKAEGAAIKAHFQDELKRLEALIPARVLGHFKEGTPAHLAVQMEHVPTQEEQQAAAAIKQ